MYDDDDKRRLDEEPTPPPPDKRDEFKHSEGHKPGVFVPPKVEIPEPPEKDN